MGDIADDIIESIEREEAEVAEQVFHYMNLDQEKLMTSLINIIDDENYEENNFTSLVRSIHQAHLKGYTLTEKQRRAVANHIARTPDLY